jgi:hypothetical protein
MELLSWYTIWTEPIPFGVNIAGEEVIRVAIFHHGTLAGFGLWRLQTGWVEHACNQLACLAVPVVDCVWLY